MPITYSGPYYTSQTEVERLFSSLAVELRRDDFEDTDPEYDNVLEEVLLQAHYEVKSIINRVYSDANALLHPWIRKRATYIAAYFLSIRRGNDSQYFNEYFQALEDLEALVKGELFIDDLAANINSLVTYCNISSDNRYPFTPMRVDPISAVPDTVGVKFVHRYIPFSWL